FFSSAAFFFAASSAFSAADLVGGVEGRSSLRSGRSSRLSVSGAAEDGIGGWAVTGSVLGQAATATPVPSAPAITAGIAMRAIRTDNGGRAARRGRTTNSASCVYQTVTNRRQSKHSPARCPNSFGDFFDENFLA